MKPVFTKEGKEIVNDFIANLAALQKEVVDAGKDRRGDAEIPTEEDILQDILLCEENFEAPNANYYPATECYGLWLTLEYETDYIWE